MLLSIFPDTPFTLAVTAQRSTSPLSTLLYWQVKVAVVVQDLLALLETRFVDHFLAVFTLPLGTILPCRHLDASTPFPGDGRVARVVCQTPHGMHGADVGTSGN